LLRVVYGIVVVAEANGTLSWNMQSGSSLVLVGPEM
jgi:hypothetical protein